MRKFKRLIRADNLTNVYKSTFKNLGKDGRELLKQVEEYKYKMNQSKNVFNDEKFIKKIDKYIEDLNNVSAFIYDFVFELENQDIVDDYDRQIEFTVPKEKVEDTEQEETKQDTTETKNDVEDKEETDNEEVDTENMDDEENSAPPENMEDLFNAANENDENLDEPLE